MADDMKRAVELSDTVANCDYTPTRAESQLVARALLQSVAERDAALERIRVLEEAVAPLMADIKSTLFDLDAGEGYADDWKLHIQSKSDKSSDTPGFTLGDLRTAARMAGEGGGVSGLYHAYPLNAHRR